MRMRRLFSMLALLVAFAVIFSSVAVPGVSALAEGEEDYEEEYDEEEYDEEEDFDAEDYEMDVVMNFKATKITKNSVALKWDKVEDVDGYEISYKATSASNWKTVEIESNKTLKKVIKGLKVNTKYNFRIRAYIYYEEDDEDYDEEEEDYDEEYYDEEDYEDDEDYEEEDETWDDYEYSGYSKMTLKTLDKKGNGSTTALSSTAESEAHKSVKVPKLKSAKSAAAKSAVLKWAKSSNATGYEIYKSVKKNSGFKKVKTIKNNSTVKFNVKGLKSGATYYFKVRAYVKQGKDYSYTKYSAVKKVKIK